MPIASLTIVSLDDAAVMMQASAPMPSVQAPTAYAGLNGRNGLLRTQLEA